LRTVCDYVHLNPVRAKLLPSRPRCGVIAGAVSVCFCRRRRERPGWVRIDRLFGESGIPADSAAGRQEFERRLETRRHQEPDEDFQSFGGVGVLEMNGFARSCLRKSKAGPAIPLRHGNPRSHRGKRPRASSMKNCAAPFGRRRTWTRRKKGDPAKLRMAGRLRAETTGDPAMDRRAFAHGHQGASESLALLAKAGGNGNRPPLGKRSARSGCGAAGSAKRQTPVRNPLAQSAASETPSEA